MQKGIKSKQFSISDILETAWDLYKEYFRLIFLVTIVVYIPVNILLFLAPVPEGFDGLRLSVNYVQFSEIFIGVIATMAIAYAVAQKVEHNKTVDAGEAIQKALSKWLPTVGTQIIMGIFLLGLFLLLVVPGIIFSIYWTFAVLIVILRDKWGTEALSESKKIVSGRWWTVFGYGLVFGVLAIVVGMPIGQLHRFAPGDIFSSVAIDTTIDLVISFFTVVGTVFFINFDHTRKKESEVEVIEKKKKA